MTVKIYYNQYDILHRKEFNIDGIQALADFFILAWTIVSCWSRLEGPNIGQTNGLHILYKKTN